MGTQRQPQRGEYDPRESIQLGAPYYRPYVKPRPQTACGRFCKDEAEVEDHYRRVRAGERFHGCDCSDYLLDRDRDEIWKVVRGQSFQVPGEQWHIHLSDAQMKLLQHALGQD